MTLRALRILLALLLLAPAPLVAQGVGTPIVIGQSIRIESKAMASTRVINVYTPPSYAKGFARYPVLYVIDGGVDQDFHHISGLAQLGAISAMYPEMIVVGIATVNRQNELTFPSVRPDHLKEFPTHGGSARFRDFIRGEVKPFVNRIYRTSGDDAVIGESLAGLFIVETLLREPTLFDRYIAISPSLWWDGMSLSGQAGMVLAQSDAMPRSLYLTVADEGGEHQKGMDMLVAALKASAPKSLTWVYRPNPREKHATIYHGAALDALRWIGSTVPKGTM